jgi:hypothetical protein
MIPDREMDALGAAIVSADSVARGGDVRGGERVLSVTMESAAERAAGKPWEAELMERWETAVSHYACRWRLAND